MPTYEYECSNCGYAFEKELKMSQRDDPCNHECIRCHESTLLRNVGCGGFQLKGNCWARDGYARTLGDDPRWKAGTRKPTKDGR